MDLEAFEREMAGTSLKDDDVPDGSHLDGLNEEDLGEDVFAHGDGEGRSLEAGREPWSGSDRDYTYPEVSDHSFAPYSID